MNQWLSFPKAQCSPISKIFAFVLFYISGGWVHCVSFSHDGEKLGWVGHDSSVSVVNAQSQK